MIWKLIVYVIVALVVLVYLNKYLDFFDVAVGEGKSKKKQNSFKSIWESENEFKGRDSSR